MTKKRRILSVIMAVALVASMMFAMTANTYAATDAGTANITYVTYYESDPTAYEFDWQVAAAGQNLYNVVNDYCQGQGYDPTWTDSTDKFNGQSTKYLDTMLGQGAINVSYQEYSSGGGMSIDWGWVYYVNDEMPYFTLQNPCHYKAMNQYVLQAGDEVEVIYACVKSVWDANDNTTFEILDPSTVY